MSNHHGHHRSSHHSRSRSHHSSSYYSSSSLGRSRTSLGTGDRNSSSSRSNQYQQQQQQQQTIPDNSKSNEQFVSDWSEHMSSSGKVYYYNTRTGVSQWEIPSELKRAQQQQPQNNRNASPESEISESSSIRQQQDKSPSSSASSNKSYHSETLLEDKPLLTPSLEQYFNKELIGDFYSSQLNQYEEQANQYARDARLLSERILKGSVELKIAKAIEHYYEISLEAQEKKCCILKETINKIKMT